jgi:hypothetical protein
VLDERHTIEGYKDPKWNRPFGADDVVPAGRRGFDATSIRVRAGEYRLTIDKKGYAWTRKAPAQIVRRGDLVEAKVIALDQATRTGTASIDQPPIVQAAALAIDKPHRPDQADGRRQQLRAEQVQPRDAGVPPGGLVVQAVRLHDRDRPRLHADDDPAGLAGDLSGGPGQPPYSPQNYEKDFLGPDHDPLRAGAFAQRRGDQAHGRARPEAGDRLRPAASGDSAAPAVLCRSRSARATTRSSR